MEVEVVNLLGFPLSIGTVLFVSLLSLHFAIINAGFSILQAFSSMAVSFLTYLVSEVY